MANIYLEPKPNTWGVLASTLGKPMLEAAGQQRVAFPVQVAKRWYRWGESNIHLATGERLEDLEGNATLYRGKRLEDGQPLSDIIVYKRSFPGDASEEIPPIGAGFSVTLYLDDRLFDQVVDLGRTSGLPWLSLCFDLLGGPITYGDAPDGSDTKWNNKEHELVNITSVTVTIPLADQNDEKTNSQDEPPRNLKLSHPTQEQVDLLFLQTHELLHGLRSSLALLTWAVFGIAVILIVTRFL